MTRPSFQFYPGDWIRDSVSGCSLAAQGLWLRMMILAHDSERYGYLTLNGKPMPPEHVAARCGIPLDTYLAFLAELDRAGVPSRTPDGTIFSRRMVRDEKDRRNNRERQLRHYYSNNKPNTNITPSCEDEGEVGVSVVGKGAGGRAEGLRVPTEGECEFYASKIGMPMSEMVKFRSFYESNGWRVGKNPMKNWKAAMSGWRARWEERRNATNGHQTASARDLERVLKGI